MSPPFLLAANISNARIERGYSQWDLAGEIGVDVSVIESAESGDEPPSHALLKKIAEAFEMRLLPPTFEEAKKALDNK